jgi:beta-lactamase regulating signal transducer with metallopeptidase domain/tetratricopeptide (TPR) repeat protein
MRGEWLQAWSAVPALWAEGMTRACWQGGLFILAVWAVCRALPRLSPAACCWLWWLAGAKLILGLVWTTPLPLRVLPVSRQPEIAAAANVPSTVPVDAVAGDAPLPRAAIPAPALRIPDAAMLRRPAVDVAALLLLIWLAALAGQLPRLGHGLRAALRLLREARPVSEPWVEEEADRLAARLGLHRRPPVRESASVAGPLVTGLRHPVVLLPAGAAERFSPAELRMALAHELAHVARGDLLLSVAPRLAQALFFFFPPARLAAREWATHREAACDGAALQASGARPTDYGRLLLKLAAAPCTADPAPALGATAGFRALQRRIQMLPQFSTPPRRWRRIALVSVAALAVAGVLPWRLIARAAPSHTKPVAESGVPADPAAEAAMLRCTEQLREIGQAMQAYRRDHGELPAHLTDLFPRYVTDLKLFHCPADPTGGSPRLSDDFADDIAPPADPRPVSYAYYVSPVVPRVNFGGLGGPLAPHADRSWRGQMLAMREQFGDRVPVVRCWHHAKTSHAAYSQPLVLSVTLEGQVYRGQGNWQNDPSAFPVVLDRLESDLSQGPQSFLRRWNLGSIAGLFSNSPTQPALRNRLRAIAMKLGALPPGLTPTDRVTYMPTDLPAAIGSLYYAAGDTEKAIAAYQRAIDHVELHTYYHGGELAAAHRLPALYGEKGQHDRAVAVYLRMTEKEPEKWDWYILMAREHEAMGQTAIALALRQKWDPSGLLVGKPAPEFEIRDQKGKPGNFAELRGRVVVLFFRNSAYPRQDVVMRELDALQRQYGGQGLSVVCLSRLVDMGAATEQAPKNHSYQLLLGMDFIYERYGVRDSSMLYIVDQQGKVVTRYVGYGYDPGEERWLEQTVRKLLAPQVAKSRAGDVTVAGPANPARPRRRQVLLRTRVLEVKKQRAQDLGIDWGSLAGNNPARAISQPFLFGHRAAGGGRAALNPIGATVRALEQQDALHVLSAPNQLVREGEKGTIHIGGEIPIPLPPGKKGSAASIGYLPFGILLVVNVLGISEDDISLRVRFEASTIDPSRSVSQNGFSVPGVLAHTAVGVERIRPGDSLAIGGSMLQNQVKNPVLAGLLKSPSFRKGESELVILVTPELKESV